MSRVSIDQFSPCVRERDAIGNEVVALQMVLTKLGYSSRIFAEEAGTVVGQRVHQWRRYRGSARDLLLIHYSYGSAAYQTLCSLPQRKILLYHAPTPAKYLAGLNPAMPATAVQAVHELPRLASSIDTAVAHSAFTAQDLQAAGYRSIQVVPYLLYEPLYRPPPDKEVLARFQGDGWKNLLAVGRIVPNKCLEDCLFVLDFLKRYVDPHWRLFLVGSWKGTEAYKGRLQNLAERMDLADIHFAGSVPQSSLLAYYTIADALLFMSEHEGLGVPLIEAMRMDVPVFAYAAGSVPEVMGDIGVLFQTKVWPIIAETVALATSDHAWRERVLSCQRDRVAAFSADLIEQRWRVLIEQLLAATSRAAHAGSYSYGRCRRD